MPTAIDTEKILRLYGDLKNLPHPQGDVAQALSWYRRARDLGESDAELWIQALETKSGR
jgi:hypothetical protein